MSELRERLWAVLSERGREATALTYEEAAMLVGELRDGAGRNGGKLSGLCIVTDRAGSHVAPAKKSAKARGKRQKAKVKKQE